jgi:hypothetical protein
MSPDDEILARVGLAVAAFSIWLTIRIFNRRERWAKRTAAVLVAVPILYVLSFGPACWWFTDRSFGYAFRMPSVAYWPMGWTVRHSPKPVSSAVCWYAKVGNSEELLVPAEWGGFSAGIILH